MMALTSQLPELKPAPIWFGALVRPSDCNGLNDEAGKPREGTLNSGAALVLAAAPVIRPSRQAPLLPSACQLKPSWRSMVRSISAIRTRTLTWMLDSTANCATITAFSPA